MNPNDFYLLSAFTGDQALGNQACVLLLDDISDTQKLHAIAKDFNQPATTFLKKRADGYDVRWFAPDAEIGLCGHGTIAATWLLCKELGDNTSVAFYYNGGVLRGEVQGERVAISGDAIVSVEQEIPDHVDRGFNGMAKGYFANDNKHLVLLDNEAAVRNMKPNWDALRESKTFGYVITAQGEAYDCVSRVILPYVSFLEDQATGSAHMSLAPYWANRLGKPSVEAFQASQRGGRVTCEMMGDQVRLSAECRLFASGTSRP